MDNQQAKTAFDVGWLVGFMEGEGCCTLRKQVYKRQKPTFRPEVMASSTDYELADRAIEIIRKYVDCGIYVYDRKTSGQTQRVFKIGGLKRCKKILAFLIPHMTVSRKKKAAQNLLDFCEYRLSLPHGKPYTEKDFRFGQRQRDLNGYQLRQSFRDSTRDVFNYNAKVESART